MTMEGKFKVTIEYEDTSCHHLKARASSHKQAKGVEPIEFFLTTC
jgi:hypothetical protein